MARKDKPTVNTAAETFFTAKVQHTDPEPKTRAFEAGCRDGWARHTFIIQKDTADDFRALAHLRRETLGDLVDAVLAAYAGKQGDLDEARALYAEKGKKARR